MKTPSAVKEWLTEFKTLRDAEAARYGARLLRRHDLFLRLSEYIEQCYNKDELDPVLSQIFNCFRHPQKEIFLFALQLLPSLFYVYLRNFTAWKEYGETVESLETCLLGMYNLAHARLRTPSSGSTPMWCTLSDFRIPSLSEPSIFHDALPQLSPWLEREDTGRMVRTGLQLSVERRITAENRFQILTILQVLYNDELASMPPQSLRHFLQCLERLVSLDAEPRIPLGGGCHGSGAFLGHCLTALYFALFNGQSGRGLAVINSLEERANFELMPEVLLVLGAIRNSLMTNPSGQPADGPMGICVDLAATPPAAREARARGHTVITNASFRTKKLPEDIQPDPSAKEDSSIPPNAAATFSLPKKITEGTPIKEEDVKLEMTPM